MRHISGSFEQFDNLIQLSELVETLDKPFFTSVQAFDSKNTYAAKRHRAVISSHTKEVLSIVSDKYKIVHSGAIVKDVCAALSKLGLHEVSGSIIEQRGRTFARVLLPKYISETKGNEVGQDIQLGFQLINSYDATRSLKLSGFAMRLVCSNGMVAPQILGTAFVRKHIGSGLSDDIQKAVTDLISEIVKRSTYLQEVIDEAMNDMIGDETELLIALGNYGFGERTSKNILTHIQKWKNGAVSRWELYNAVTSYYSHENISENARTSALEKAEKFLLKEVIA